MNQTTVVEIQRNELEIQCSDETVLSATLFEPKESKAKAGVMIAPATGILQTFYSAFASWLAKHGYTVITFDNRGIGKSLIGHVRDSKASLIDWGKLDMPAVLDTLKENTPDVPYHLIGHSAGGQLLGLMHNSSSITSMCNFACSSGNLSNMDGLFKFQAHYFMNIFIPLNNMIFGYTNSQWAGMGQPLPKAAAQQWRKWCNGTGYVQTDFGNEIKQHLYDELTMPGLWLHANDDPIANLENVEEMARVYTRSESTIVTLDPDDYGLKTIGHMKFFSRSNKSLWPIALKWLEQGKV